MFYCILIYLIIAFPLFFNHHEFIGTMTCSDSDTAAVFDMTLSVKDRPTAQENTIRGHANRRKYPKLDSNPGCPCSKGSRPRATGYGFVCC